MSEAARIRSVDAGENGSMVMAIEFPAELIESIAQRTAAIVLERQTSNGGSEWLDGAKEIAHYAGWKVSRVYALNSQGALPLNRDGSKLKARKSEIDAFIENGGAKRV